MMVMMIVMVMVMVMIMMMMLLVFVMVMVMVMVMVLIIKVALMMFDINDILRQSLTHLFCFNLSRKCRETGVFRYPCLYRSRKRNGEFH